MAQVEISDVTLYAPGVPVQVLVSEVTLTAPAQSLAVLISNITLEAPSAAVEATGSISTTYDFRPVLNGGVHARADLLPVTIEPRVRLQASADQRLGTISTALTFDVRISGAAPRHVTEQISTLYRFTVSIDAAFKPPVVLDQSQPARGILHLAWPLNLRPDGTLGSVAQDSDADVDQTAGVLLATEPGTRRALPEFGFRDHTFRAPPTDAEVEAAVTLWDPRVAQVETSAVQTGDDLEVKVSIRKGG